MIRYNSEHERLVACRENETRKSAMAKNLGKIIEAHKGMCRRMDRKEIFVSRGGQLVADVLSCVIEEIIHNQAEQDWLFNIEMKEGDNAKTK